MTNSYLGFPALLTHSTVQACHVCLFCAGLTASSHMFALLWSLTNRKTLYGTSGTFKQNLSHYGLVITKLLDREKWESMIAYAIQHGT